MSTRLTPQDIQEAKQHGISEADLEWQVELLSHPPHPVVVERPCTVGDGIIRLDGAEQKRLVGLFARSRNRFSKFVPASGAASRMFKTLAAGDLEDLERLRRELDAFPFAEIVAAGLDSDPSGERIAELLLSELDFGSLPKGLLPFHRYTTGVRTAFEEHLAETADILGSPFNIHFTISDQHRALFEKELDRIDEAWEDRSGAPFGVSFSHQSPATDTVALDAKGRLLRKDGRLVFRPGGHGALLQNLQATGADLVLIKNIDNIVPQDRRQPSIEWKQVLGGLLLELESAVQSHLRGLETGGAAEQDKAAAFVETRFGVDLQGTSIPRLTDQLNRPLRVCGVVANQGEPGGGPFWAHTPEGLRPQIVERSQADEADSGQRQLLDQATHFNPVDLAVTLRGANGRPYNLKAWVDPSTAFIARKSLDGQEILALERPGLWNGAMGRWNTVFVEVPIETFAPVKTVFDFLRPQHQPRH